MSTLHEINEKAHRLLRAELGPVDYARSQQQFTQGTGDYTADRQALVPAETRDAARQVAEMKTAGLIWPPNGSQKL